MAGLFSFIESFFFLSIGITFVLILLLVYHFKQRLTLLEQKSETIVSIVNQLTHEMTYMKPMMSHTIHSGGDPSAQGCGQGPQPNIVQGWDLRSPTQSSRMNITEESEFEQFSGMSHPHPDQCPIGDSSIYRVEEIDDEEEEDDEEDDEEEDDDGKEEEDGPEEVQMNEELPLDDVLEFEPPTPAVPDEDVAQPPEITLHSDSSSKHGKISIYELRAMAVKKGLITVNESTKFKKSELQRMLDQ